MSESDIVLHSNFDELKYGKRAQLLRGNVGTLGSIKTTLKWSDDPEKS